MVVNKEILKDLFHGWLDSRFDDSGRLHLHRFTKHQQEAYLAKGEKTLKRCNASANIYLDLITDSDYLKMNFDAYNASAVSYAGFDLHVDGVFTDKRFFHDWHTQEIGFPLPHGTHRVTMYLPWSWNVVVRSVELSDNAVIETVSRAHRGMVFGDSITQGYTTLMPSLSYANILGRELDAEIINQGAGGFYFDETTVDEALPDFRPEFLVIAYGTNDFSRNSDPDVFRENAKKYIHRFHQVFCGRNIYGVLPIFRSDSNVTDPAGDARYSFQDAREILAEIYEEYPDITIIRETGIPRIHEAFAEDCVHPTDFGHMLMSKGIEKAIRMQQVCSARERSGIAE